MHTNLNNTNPHTASIKPSSVHGSGTTATATGRSCHQLAAGASLTLLCHFVCLSVILVERGFECVEPLKHIAKHCALHLRGLILVHAVEEPLEDLQTLVRGGGCLVQLL
eukprot:GDKI01021882.1.p1 GENE.GDKI01021882.1~~GDKI01021882.1.p1  ORF type:complete len:109 (+),score=15.97 GDKI01021882.1:325-651(+)